MASLADFHQLSLAVVSGVHGAADDLSADRADVQAGMAVKGTVHIFCSRSMHRLPALFANHDVFSSAGQCMSDLI